MEWLIIPIQIAWVIWVIGWVWPFAKAHGGIGGPKPPPPVARESEHARNRREYVAACVQREKYFQHETRLQKIIDKGQIPWDMGVDLAPWAGQIKAMYADRQPAAAAESPEPPKPSAPVFFKPGEPQTFEEYDGQEHVTEYLQAAINGLAPDQVAIGNHCFIGFAGTGKTLLAKIVTETLRRRAERLGLPAPVFIEAFPADLGDIVALDALMLRVQQNPGCVLFIDEVHDLVGSHSLKVYMVLEDHRYAATGAANPVEMPPFTFLAATTDFGAMHPALQRRFRRHQFKPATPEQLVEYVLRRATKCPITVPVATRIVSRTKYSGAPWEAIELYEMALTMALGRGATHVADQDVSKIFELQGIDDLGLRWFDQRVVKTLLTSPRYRNAKGGRELVCYGASESDVCMMAQVDAEEYRRSIKPRLMSRGLLTMRPGYGQALTDAAVARYQVQS